MHFERAQVRQGSPADIQRDLFQIEGALDLSNQTKLCVASTLQGFIYEAVSLFHNSCYMDVFKIFAYLILSKNWLYYLRRISHASVKKVCILLFSAAKDGQCPCGTCCEIVWALWPQFKYMLSHASEYSEVQSLMSYSISLWICLRSSAYSLFQLLLFSPYAQHQYV